MKLLIAEKPSVVVTIAKVIGARIIADWLVGMNLSGLYSSTTTNSIFNCKKR